MPGPQRRHPALRRGDSTNFRSVTRVDRAAATRSTTTVRSSLPTDLGNATGGSASGPTATPTLRREHGEHLRLPRRQAGGHAVVPRAPGRVAWTRARSTTTWTPLGGQSGSAVYRIVNGSGTAIAVHAYGGGDDELRDADHAGSTTTSWRGTRDARGRTGSRRVGRGARGGAGRVRRGARAGAGRRRRHRPGRPVRPERAGAGRYVVLGAADGHVPGQVAVDVRGERTDVELTLAEEDA